MRRSGGRGGTRRAWGGRTLASSPGAWDHGGRVAVQLQPADIFLSRGTGLASGGHALPIYRPLRLDAAQRAAVVAKAREYLGREYGYFQLVGHFLDWFLQGPYVFRRLTGSDDYPICSWVVAHAFAVVGVTFGVEPGAAQPDDIHDYVSTHPDPFERIREFAPL